MSHQPLHSVTTFGKGNTGTFDSWAANHSSPKHQQQERPLGKVCRTCLSAVYEYCSREDRLDRPGRYTGILRPEKVTGWVQDTFFNDAHSRVLVTSSCVAQNCNGCSHIVPDLLALSDTRWREHKSPSQPPTTWFNTTTLYTNKVVRWLGRR